MSKAITALMMVGVLSTSVPAVFATPLAPDVMLSVKWDANEWLVDIGDVESPWVWEVIYNEDEDTWRMTGGWTPPVSEPWYCQWDVIIDVDPLIFGGFSFTNNLPISQDYSVSLLLPTTVPAPAMMRGSIAGTLLDGTDPGDGATLQTVNGVTPIYTALIDAVPVQTLLDAPYTTSVGPGGNDNWGPPAPASFGWIGAPPVAISIGIDHEFNLTANNDTASFTTLFEVVPEPASLLLLALGGLALLRRR